MQGVIAPLGDCREDGWEGHFRSNVVRVIVDKLVEVIGVGCGIDGKCKGPSRVRFR